MHHFDNAYLSMSDMIPREAKDAAEQQIAAEIGGQ
jgi:hypothetical protein